MSVNLYPIGTKSKIVSKNLRDNFAEIEAKLNSIQAQIDAVLTPPIGSEVPNARPHHASLLERLDSQWKGQANYKKYGGDLSVNTDTSKIDVSAGEAKVGGVDIKWSALVSGSITAAASGKHRIDIVVAQSDNSILILEGTESNNAGTSPYISVVSSNQLILGYIYVDDTDPVDNTGNLFKNYTLSGGDMTIDFVPNTMKYITLNGAAASISLDTTLEDLSLFGTMTIVITHHSAECALTITNEAYHINIDGKVADQIYTIPAGITKKTIIQIYYDEVNLYVMENPFYKVVS